MSHRRSGGVARPHVRTPPEDTQPEIRSGEFILEKDAIVEVVSQNLEKGEYIFFLSTCFSTTEQKSAYIILYIVWQHCTKFNRLIFKGYSSSLAYNRPRSITSHLARSSGIDHEQGYPAYNACETRPPHSSEFAPSLKKNFTQR